MATALVRVESRLSAITTTTKATTASAATAGDQPPPVHGRQDTAVSAICSA